MSLKNTPRSRKNGLWRQKDLQSKTINTQQGLKRLKNCPITSYSTITTRKMNIEMLDRSDSNSGPLVTGATSLTSEAKVTLSY